MDDNDQLEGSGHATAAREHVYGFNRATMWARDQIQAETSDELAEFADLAAALPQAFSQLSSTLEQALADQVLSMDSMTDESDPASASTTGRSRCPGTNPDLVVPGLGEPAAPEARETSSRSVIARAGRPSFGD